MTVIHPIRMARAFLLGLALLLIAALPAIAHAELVSSDPSDKAVLQPAFDGPIVLTYDEPLFPGSKADLKGPEGSTVASAKVDADKLVFTLDGALDPGAYLIQWVSVGADRDLARGELTFTVAPPPATPTAGATASPAATLTPTASPTPSADGTPTGISGDILLPLLAAVIAVGAIGGFLLRNRRTAGR